jgi:hypothetical protein
LEFLALAGALTLETKERVVSDLYKSNINVKGLNLLNYKIKIEHFTKCVITMMPAH